MAERKLANLRGPRGRSVETAQVVEDNLVLTFSDGKTVDAGEVRGRRGIPSPGAVPADEAVAAFIEDGVSRDAVRAVAGTVSVGEPQLPKYLKSAALFRPETQSGYRKRVIHNLQYQHADWAAANALWGTLFPQAFVIDEVAREILTISDGGIVSVYDWDTGEYLSHCFRLAGVSVTNQSLVVRYQGAARYLYARQSSTVFARYDITTFPSGVVEVAAADTYAVSSLSDFAYRDGVWTIASLRSDMGGTSYSDRGKFIRYDENFTQIGMLYIDPMRYGGVIGGGMYGGAKLPKSQGFEAGPGSFAISVGGGWNSSMADPITDPYFYQGVRVYSPAGETIADSLVSAETMLEFFTDLGFMPSHIEAEGIAFAFGHYHSLYAIAGAGSPGAANGGIVIMEEFSTHNDAYDFAGAAVEWTSPTVRAASTGLHPIDASGRLANLVTAESLTTVWDVFQYMRAVGQHRLSFYAGVANITDPDGNTFPTNGYVECVIATSSTLQVRVTTTRGTRVYLYWWNGSEWVWTKPDSGWVDIAVASGFAPISTDEKPQCRLRDGIVYLRGGFSNTGISASGSFMVGTIPSGYRPTVNAHAALASSTGAATASAIISTNGQISIRTDASVGAYYGLGSFTPFITD